MSSSADILLPNGDTHDHVLRPRPRKPQHSQVTALTHMASDETDGISGQHLSPAVENGSTSGLTR